MPNPASFVEEYIPPPPSNEDAGEMQRWLYSLYDKALRDGGSFPKLTVSSANDGDFKLEAHNLWQDLITANRGIYVDYSTANSNIVYGFACNVRRTNGPDVDGFVVGGQINAWACDNAAAAFGGNILSLGSRRHTGALIGCEFSAVPENDNSLAPKIGGEYVWISRANFNGAIGSNRYNYFSRAMRIGSIASLIGELEGWNVGVQFVSGGLNAENPPTWDATINYAAGQTVIYLGAYYKAIIGNLNQVPAAVSAYWVPHRSAGAIGVDLSSLDITTMGNVASAFRVRDTMRYDFNAEGTVGQFYDPFTTRMVLVSNLGLGAAPADRVLEVDVITGFLYRFGVFLI